MSSSDAIGFPKSSLIPPVAPSNASKTDARQSHFTQLEAAENTLKGPLWRAKVRNWVDDCKQTLEVGKQWLDRVLPNTRKQQALDDFGRKIDNLLSQAKPFNDWIHSNGMGAWYQQLCVCLMKLPIRIVADVIQFVYGAIKSTAYAFVHPLKASFEMGKTLLEILYSLTLPETYIKIGAGTIGSSLGHVAITGGFGVHSYVGLGIGGGLLITGILWGAIEAGVTEKEKHPAKAVMLIFWEYAKTVPESLLVGFLVGITLGAIQLHTFGNITGRSPPDMPHIRLTVAEDHRT